MELFTCKCKQPATHRPEDSASLDVAKICATSGEKELTILKCTGGPPNEVKPMCQQWRAVFLNCRAILAGCRRSQPGHARTPIVRWGSMGKAAGLTESNKGKERGRSKTRKTI